MPLTSRQIANDCLAHCNLTLSATTPFTGSEAAGTLLPVGCEAYLVNTLNLAAEEMREAAPRIFRDTVGVVFGAPTTGTVTVTNGSRSVTLGTLAAPANGSTIVISGDPVFNEIKAASSNYELLHPYGGPSGTVTAECFGDSQILSTSVDTVLGAIAIAGRRPLHVLNSRADLLYYHAEAVGDYGQLISPGLQQRRKTGQPEAVYLETAPTHSGSIEYRLRCAPLPSERIPTEIEVQFIPTEITSSDLNASSTFVFPTVAKRQYSIFRALALYHWLSAPWVRPSSTALKAIERGYAHARSQLETYRPNSAAAPRVVLLGT